MNKSITKLLIGLAEVFVQFYKLEKNPTPLSENEKINKFATQIGLTLNKIIHSGSDSSEAESDSEDENDEEAEKEPSSSTWIQGGGGAASAKKAEKAKRKRKKKKKKTTW